MFLLPGHCTDVAFPKRWTTAVLCFRKSRCMGLSFPVQTAMLGLNFPHKISKEYFGGKEAFYRALMDVGLIAKSCQCSSTDLTLYFERGKNFPRAYCKGCGKRSLSLNNGSVFQTYGIADIPAFIFVCNCFVMNVPFEATVILSGLDSGTVQKYIDHITKSVDLIIKDENCAMEGMLGGDGKVVEIDEVFVSKRKYNKGRMPAKGRVIVFGMTERDGG